MSSLHPVSGEPAEILALLRAWQDAAEDPGPLMIATSGSTGRPKRVLLSRAAMRASALATHERLDGPAQWVLNLPPDHVAGLQVLFRSVLALTEPLVVTDDRSWHGRPDLASAVASATQRRVVVSLVPTQLHRYLADARQTEALTRCAAVLVGGGPMRPDDREAALAAGVPVVATYGMSETCGGCVYDGVPLDGVQVRIGDETDPAAVLLRGPMVFDGYDGEPERTAQTLRDGWLRTHDLGELADGRLRITGRADDVIISGGVKVPPLAVGQQLLAHPAVGDAHVIGVPDAEWGERVVAVVTGDPELAELRALVTPRTWAPREVRRVETLPRLANGKVDAVAVREMLKGRGCR